MELDALAGAAKIISQKNTMFFVEFCPVMLNARGCGDIEIFKMIEGLGYSFHIFRAHPIYCIEEVSANILISIYHENLKRGFHGTFELMIIPPN